jgi:hypothetical protein
MIYRILLPVLATFAIAAAAPCAAQSPAASDVSSSAAPASGTPAPTGNPQSSSPAPPAAAPAPASSASTTASSGNSAPQPSPELVKKARSEGFKPKVQKNGETLFCRKDASMNTRLETEKCYTMGQIESIFEQRDQMHDQLAIPRGCAGAACGSN